jgi:SAM-dependent methyltransferase
MATSEDPRTRWEQLTGGASGRDYAARFEALAAEGRDLHGEATFCASLLAPGGRVLDAGCGTGRVAIRLAELGFDCTGVDVDASMLSVARETAPQLKWLQADLSTLTVADVGGEPFDLVVLAGNVVPLLAAGSLPRTAAALAVLLRQGGLLVAGFGLDPAHLPAGCPVTPLAEYDEACSRSGLSLVDRYSTWDREPFDEAAGYAVSLHRS